MHQRRPSRPLFIDMLHPRRGYMLAALILAGTACTIQGAPSDDDDDSGYGTPSSGAGGTVNNSSNGQGGNASAQAGAGTTAGNGGAASTSTGSGQSPASGNATSSGSGLPGSSSSTSSGGPNCGDNVCDATESCQTCGEDCATSGANASNTTLDAEEQAFLQIINNYRAENALGKLTGCKSLHRTAQGHSEDMRDNDYFSHTGLNNSAPWDRACDACFEKGCGPQTTMAENIAAGNTDAQSTFIQWKNSPGHNANMLNGDYNYIGIGRATGGGTYGVYWTNVFSGADEGSCY